MDADGLDGRHQIHEGFAATAMNSGQDHERRPTQAGALPSPSHRRLTEPAGDRAQPRDGNFRSVFSVSLRQGAVLSSLRLAATIRRVMARHTHDHAGSELVEEFPSRRGAK
jgi:hypothetical protein